MTATKEELLPTLNIWPRAGVPLVFCHVEGIEKSLSVSTADGGEQSKSNEEERAEAVIKNTTLERQVA